ncbi:MAG TPA: 3-methyl-2-oxobutanoate dehydrogenase subunit beta, partial [Candidatus Bathyarchaeia archaeon]|nr:3-methyl-2-oxobutanoate dehydrogenase subunit beta [Candidatus Bathyarchaeia archaeon]
VIIDVNRGGPGLGNLGVEQSDYFQATRGGGHGGYQLIVLAPNSVQEMLSFPKLAFDLAFKYRNPVLILSDAFLGQLKEDVAPIHNGHANNYDTSWATLGMKGGGRHILNSLHLDPEAQEKHERLLHAKYASMATETRFEHLNTTEADIVLVSYGITSRICKSAVKTASENRLTIGLFRPITLNPFPYEELSRLANQGKKLLVVELNAGQMVQDVQLAVAGKTQVEQFGRLGGNFPTVADIIAKCEEMSR